ncbi:Jnm1p KNAG_0E01500 [Huiozyma naganishii CBS 8797]|uniref:Uncharacterized protein n=1 Tax=Huiozyma naganishii (strain ATCC MYA-139 / BCRC 22969 / CBS 8797 / KCTC 17520 / NBRC 10181 / NCYC 3082 / Yp74L-3) TaxID=1071383 RepID=J7S6J2_HUIN7|nr:hypothetical protein KNAG_0E01500 [Kazachstania naganishii CBS 8797]CCK70414.1 hypothetical protein KNAG_0E01500 [Kazachstania naganishii CBS 8797]
MVDTIDITDDDVCGIFPRGTGEEAILLESTDISSEDETADGTTPHIVTGHIQSVQEVQKVLPLGHLLANDLLLNEGEENRTETTESTLERIRRELLQLEVSNDETLEKEYASLWAFYDKLAAQQEARILSLERDMISKLDKSIRASSPPDTTILPRNVQLNYSSLQRIMALETRISQVEAQLGPSYLFNAGRNNDDDNGDESFSRPFVSQIDELHRHMNLLLHNPTDANGITALEERLVALNKNFEASLLGKKLQREPDALGEIDCRYISDETKIERICAAYEEIMQYAVMLPQLTTKLRDVNQLNHKVNETLKIVRGWDNILQDMRADTTKWSHLIDKVDRKLDAQYDEVMSKLEGLKSQRLNQ